MPNITMRTLLGLFFPPGDAWRPVVGHYFDRILEGIADEKQEVFDYLATLADVRDPQLTTILSDLEKEYGTLTNENILESIRRDRLASIKYAKASTGDEDNLQRKLDDAGYDLSVHQNEPPIDPAIVLDIGYAMVAGGGNAYAGEPTAIAGAWGGELVVNGDQYIESAAYSMQAGGEFAYAGNSRAVAGYFQKTNRELIEYTVPSDPAKWPRIFFVGGDRSGWEHFLDWDMNKAYTDDWTPGAATSLEKDPTPTDAHMRTLRVNANRNLANQEVVPEQPDPSLLGAYLMNDAGAGGIANLAHENFLIDGDMEDAGTAAWTAGNSAILTKQSTDPVSGLRYLRISYNGVSYPNANQTILTVGKKYWITGRGRGDGTSYPKVYNNVTGNIWIGTISAAWQEIDEIFTAGHAQLLFQMFNTIPGFVEFDNISVNELPDIQDGDMEDAGTAAWTAGNSATLTKEIGGPHSGNQLLRVAYNGVTDPYAFQTMLTVGEIYRAIAYVRSDGTAIPAIKNGAITVPGTSSQKWQKFDAIFTALATDVQFIAQTAVDGYCEFDDVTISPVLSQPITNNGADNISTQFGRALDFDGATEWADAGTIGSAFTDNFTLTAWIWRGSASTQAIVSRYDGANKQFSLGLTPTKVLFDDGTLGFIGDTALELFTWYHIGVSINGASSQLYLNGQPDGGTFSPSITTQVVNTEIGSIDSGGARMFDGIIAMPQVIREFRPAPWFSEQYQMGIDTALNGSYAEQELDAPVISSRTLTADAWGDGADGIPLIAAREPVTNIWLPIWFGKNTTDKQTVSVEIDSGISAVRLYTKFAEDGFANFDNISILNPAIERGQVVNNEVTALKKIILQNKPLASWCGLIIDRI